MRTKMKNIHEDCCCQLSSMMASNCIIHAHITFLTFILKQKEWEEGAQATWRWCPSFYVKLYQLETRYFARAPGCHEYRQTLNPKGSFFIK
jgi:hypothetical protein